MQRDLQAQVKKRKGAGLGTESQARSEIMNNR